MVLITYIVRGVILSLCVASVAAAFIGPVDIVSKVTNDSEFTIYMPQVVGLKDAVVAEHLNTRLSRNLEYDKDVYRKRREQNMGYMPESAKKNLHFWGTYAVKLNKNGLLSITVGEYTYTGGAHGNALLYAYTFNTEDGGQYNLQDIFKPEADYRNRLEAIIKKDIMSHNKNNYHFEQLKENQDFYLTEEGLVVFFQPYEIASWADGFVRFIIPYNQISDLINAKLPLY